MITSGFNADIVAGAAQLYIKPGAVVADVTYGKGAFWSKTDLSTFSLLCSDLKPRLEGVVEADFCNLPYSDTSVDVLVIDPPYIHNPGNHLTNNLYNNKETTCGLYHDDIIRLYMKGMMEAHRVLKNDGLLWVKCKDEVESGWGRFSHCELYNVAESIGFQAKDLCILLTEPPTKGRWKGEQRHLRKNHSFLWIFQIVRRRKSQLLVKQKSSTSKVTPAMFETM